MNRHFASQQRAIILTDKKLYKLDPDDKYKLKKSPILNKDIVSAMITDEPENQLIVLKIRNIDSDFIFYIESKDFATNDRVTELLANIYRSQIK